MIPSPAQLFEGYPTFTHTLPQVRVSLNGSVRQAKLCYLSFYCRTGGVDWPLLKQNYDGVVIRAGQGGYGYDELLHEHVDLANEHGVPYMTSWQSDRRQDMRQQGYFFSDGYGVKGHRASIAHENTGSGLVTPYQALTINQTVTDALGEKPLNYSRQNIIFSEWNYPEWLNHYQWEIARYPYTFEANIQYRSVDKFLEERAWTFPRDLPEDFQEFADFWQVSEKIDARATFANARTNDPNYSSGLLSGTASVGLHKDYRETVSWMGGVVTTPEPPNPEPEPGEILYYVKVRENMVYWNIRSHPANPAWYAKDMGDAGGGLELAVFEEVELDGYTWLRCGGDNFWLRSDGTEII